MSLRTMFARHFPNRSRADVPTAWMTMATGSKRTDEPWDHGDVLGHALGQGRRNVSLLWREPPSFGKRLGPKVSWARFSDGHHASWMSHVLYIAQYDQLVECTQPQGEPKLQSVVVNTPKRSNRPGKRRSSVSRGSSH